VGIHDAFKVVLKREFVYMALAVAFCASLLGQSPATPATGMWQASDVTSGPWSIELTQNGTTLTGSVRQAGAQGGPVTISDGSVAGNTLTFKAVSPDGARTITFTGTLKSDEIEFKRSVEVRNNSVGGAGIFGGRAVAEFTAKRVNAAAATATTAAGARGARGARGTATATPVNPTNSPDGRWTAAAVGGGPWTFDFKSEGARLTGTARQAGPPEATASVTDGRIDGTRITFKITSPDGARTITFLGRINAGEISFVRQFDLKPGASRWGNDLFGASSSLQFVAKRAAEQD
jgi:hypothetical protein